MTRRLELLIAVYAGALALGVPTARAADVNPPPQVRTSNARIAEAIDFAAQRSPSFRDLLATLEFLDRVVYVEEGACRHREQRGCLQVLPGGTAIYIKIDPRQTIRSVVAQLAHELYHAVEVAREPAVVNAATLRELYIRIGERSCTDTVDSCWETRAAVAFEALVTRQLNASSGQRPPGK